MDADPDLHMAFSKLSRLRAFHRSYSVHQWHGGLSVILSAVPSSVQRMRLTSMPMALWQTLEVLANTTSLDKLAFPPMLLCTAYRDKVAAGPMTEAASAVVQTAIEGWQYRKDVPVPEIIKKAWYACELKRGRSASGQAKH